MKKLVLLSAMVMTLISFSANAQSIDNKGKHEVKVFVSDASTLTMSDFFADGLSSALSPKEYKKTTEGTIMPGISYNYFLTDKVFVGADLGYQNYKMTEKLTGKKVDSKIDSSVSEKSHRLLVLPTVGYVYYQKGLIRLYGNAGAGTMFSFNKTDYAKDKKSEKETKTSFAYQVNPIALRVGNEQIGAFVEAGIGYKGFASVGVSYTF